MAATAPPAPSEFRKAMKKFLPHLIQAQQEGLNEADTVQRLSKFFEQVLGYDGLSEITFEAQMKGKFVDMTLKADGKIRILVEAKAGGVTLRDRHIEQAQMYASQNNYPWVLLTNGICWNLYHLTFDEGIEYERAFAIDLSKDEFESCAASLALLRRESVRKGMLDEFWTKAAALGPASLGAVLFMEDTLRHIRRELRKSEGLLVDVEDLAKALHDLFHAEARELIGPARVRRKKAKKPVAALVPPEPAPTQVVEPPAQ